MSARRFRYRGYTLEELQEMSRDEFMELLTARHRRTLSRDNFWTDRRSKLLDDIRQSLEEGKEIPDTVRTHVRDMPILPEMVGARVGVYNGKEFVEIVIRPQMIGHYIGEFSITTQRVRHGSPGIGATRSSLYVPLK
ncbi:MAG: 30S ribosomal protein S19 [Candidatus Kariarchaeaceae archaeon]